MGPCPSPLARIGLSVAGLTSVLLLLVMQVGHAFAAGSPLACARCDTAEQNKHVARRVFDEILSRGR